MFLNQICFCLKSYYHNYEFPFIQITILDFIIAFIFIIFVLITAILIAKKISQNENTLKYFLPGLLIKLFSGLVFCIFAVTFYEGDTLAYFHNMQVLRNLFFTKPMTYLDILFTGTTHYSLMNFDYIIGYPKYYMWIDHNTFSVSRLLSPITLIIGNNFFVNTLVVSIISYWGSWKLFLMFAEKYPQLIKKMAIACLFVPSVLYWGSGIMKDTLIVFSLSMILVSINNIIQFKLNFRNFIGLILSIWLIVLIKPYVFVALLPCVFIWVGYYPLQKIRSKLLKYVLIPFLSVIVIGGFLFTFSIFSSQLGNYGDYDSLVEKARITQQDLIRADQYGSNFFNIGEITGTPVNMLQLFPKAVMAGLFRPYLWEVRNVFMLMSGLENFILLMLVLSVFFRRNVRKVFQLIGKEPFLLGLFIFIIFLAFGVGLSTANFGALVRYRIPVLPVFVAAMFILKHFVKTRIEQPKVQRKDFSFGVE